MRKGERRRSMDSVAADVSPLTYLWGSLSQLTSAATRAKRFMVPMHAQKRKGALHEPCSSGHESAHFSFGKFEPTYVGCYARETVHSPDACAKAKGGSPGIV